MSKLPIDNIISPWVPITDLHTLAALGKLAEEASELAKACNRAIIQGLDGTTPGQDGTNAECITKEFVDIRAAAHILYDRMILDDPNTKQMTERFDTKLKGFKRWHKLIDEHIAKGP